MDEVEELRFLSSIPANRRTAEDVERYKHLCLKLAPILLDQLRQLLVDLPNAPVLTNTGMLELFKQKLAQEEGPVPFSKKYKVNITSIYFLLEGHRKTCPGAYYQLGYEEFKGWRRSFD